MDAQLQTKIIESLNRCQFLLNRIFQADFQALKNAEEASLEAQALLREAGFQPTPLFEEEQELEFEIKVEEEPVAVEERPVTLSDVVDFVNRCQALVDSYRQEHFPNLDREILNIDRGRRYYKIVKNGSAFAFIDARNGDILKAASWAAPAKHARGNLFDSHRGMRYMGPYGPDYLKVGRKRN